MIKCFGYEKNDSDNDNLLELTQVTLEANPKSIRILAEFLIKCADEMDSDPDWEHEHLIDYLPKFDTKVDFIIYKSD